MADLLIAAPANRMTSAAMLARRAKEAADPLCEDRARRWSPTTDTGWNHDSADPTKNIPVVGFLDFLLGRRRPHAYWGGPAHCAWISGYLSSPPKYDAARGGDARVVAEAFSQRGPAGVAGLDGAFVIALLERATGSLHVWTDRTAGVPLFLASGSDAILLAPSPRCMRGLAGMDGAWQPGSIAAMALNGAMLRENTYIRGISAVGPGMHLHIEQGRIHRERYWTRTFTPRQPDLEITPADFADRVCDSLQRHLKRFDNPVLAMSGGFDSRLILAACERIGVRMPAVTWGVDRLDRPGSDMLRAQEVAAVLGASITAHRLNLDELPANAAAVVELCDGMSTNLGAYPDGDARPRQMAAEHDAVLMGNEMFPWSLRLPSRRMALRQNGINVGRRLHLLRFLLRREVASTVLDAYAGQQAELLGDMPADAPPHDVADIVYWLSRFPRTIVGQTGLFRRHLSYVSPLLDADMLDLVSGLSEAQRLTPGFLQSLAKRHFTTAYALPMNRKHTRTNWKARLARPGIVPRFIVDTLMAPCPAFEEWFDPLAIRAWLGHAVYEGRRAAWPASTFRKRLTRSVRAVLLRPTFRERIVVNMAALKLWFMGQGKEVHAGGQAERDGRCEQVDRASG